MEYKIEIGGVDYSEYLALPFNIDRKNDSTLMTTTLNLVDTHKKEPFFQYSEAKITIDNTTYEFVVAGDDIDAIKDALHQGEFLYNHGVQLIERFKLCENYNLPSFSISRHDSSYISFNYDLVDVASNIQSQTVGEKTLTFSFGPTPQYNRLVAFDINKTPLKLKEIPKLRKKYSASETVNNNNYFAIAIDSPPTIEYQTYRYTKTTGALWWVKDVYEWKKAGILYGDLFGVSVEGTYVKNGETKSHSYSTQFGSSGALSFRLFDGRILPSNIESGKFTIKIQLLPNITALTKTLSDIAENADIKGGKNSRPTYDQCEEAITSYINYLYVIFKLQAQITLDDIEVSEELTASDVERLNYTATDACEKAFDLVEALDINKKDVPKFTLDKNHPSYSVVANALMPEVLFEKNNLAEVLRKIGKVFNGIPKLSADNSVYFDILTDISDNPNHEDDPSLTYTTSSSITNYATTMTSDVSNMIPSDNEKTYSYWPAKECWGKYLSADQSAWVYPDNAAIRIDNAINGGIYRLIEFNVRKWSKSSPSKIAHLIQRKNGIEVFNRVPQKELWDAYSKDIRGTLKADGKNYDASRSQLRTIYYTPKTSVISINEISEDQRKDFFGNEGAQFSYMYAIKDAVEYEYKTTVNFSDFGKLHDMEFQIVYIPIINSKYVGEQSNIEGLTTPMQTTYSQEDSNPSDIGFSSVVDTYLKRLGNDDISKNEYIDNLDNAPYIGEYTDFEGDRYYCDNITLTCNPGYINTKLNYTKNYNKINAMVANPKDYVQYDIPMQESVRRVTNINEYIYIRESTTVKYIDNTGSADNDLTARLWQGLSSKTSSKGSLAPIIGVYCSEFDHYGENLSPVPVFIPLKKSYGLNTIKFQMDTYDNYSITSIVGDNKNGDKYYEDFVSYVNSVGEVDRCKVGLLYDQNSNFSTSYGINSIVTSNYPIAGDNISFSEAYCKFYKYLNIRKDKREALSFVFNVHVITDIKNLDILSGFTKCVYNELDTISEEDNLKPMKLYGYKYSSSGSTQYIGDITVGSFGIGYVRLYYSGTSSGNYDGWVIKKGSTELLRKEETINTGDDINIKYYISTHTQKLETN